jgi:RNA polymerase sigma-70 factor (ECF subfamily)
MVQADRDLIRDALEGQTAATHSLVRRLRPVVQAEVAHLLMRCAPAQGRNARQEVEDMVQEVFAGLWASSGKLLRQWSPERGRSLDSWVRLVARSRALDLLRSRRRTPWGDDTSAGDEIAEHADGRRASEAMIARDLLARLEAHLREHLTDRDWMLFLSVVVERTPIKQVAAETGMSPDAIYQWRSRFCRRVLPDLAAEFAQ